MEGRDARREDSDAQGECAKSGKDFDESQYEMPREFMMAKTDSYAQKFTHYSHPHVLMLR